MGKGKVELRMTTQVLKVLGALMSNTNVEMSGADIARLTELQSGTLYPILMRLEQADWVHSEWEDGDPRELGRPRRRLYSITALGSKSARTAFREVASAIRRPVWGLS
jgi:PadR family transcriptional regulator, regulatory protein PadR